MTVDVAVQAGDAEAGFASLPVVGGIELLLWKRSNQQSQAVQLNWGKNIFEEPVIVVDGDHFTA